MSFLQLLSALHPDPLSIALAALAILQTAVLGTLFLERGDDDPSLAFAGGMGLTIAIYTAIGVLTPVDFRWIAGALAALAAGAAWRTGRDRGGLWRSLGIAFVLSLPLLVVVSGRVASEWDEFSHWLHAFRYLAVHNGLPGAPGAAPTASCCAAYPYGWPMIGYPALLIRFSESIPALLNTALLVLFGISLARVVKTGREQPGWALIAAGILATTLASPSFVPKLAFSSYADISTGFLGGVLVLCGYRIVEAAERRAELRRPILLFGLTAAALVAVKPGNLALLGCVTGGTAVLAVRIFAWRALPALAGGLILPAAVHLLWRWHVGLYLSGQELEVQAPSAWHLQAIPRILGGMLHVAAAKGGFFALALVVVGLAVWALWRPSGKLERLAIIAGLAILGYNVFLFFTYVAVFGLPDALRVASFWRYNTHLGFVLLVPVALGIRSLWHGLVGREPWSRWLAPAAIVLVLVGPVASLKYIRFDVDEMKAHLRQTLREVARIVPPDQPVSILDPKGSGLIGVLATYEWDGAPPYAGKRAAFDAIPVKDWLQGRESRWLFVVSGRDAVPGIPAGALSALVRRDANGGYDVVATWPFPGGREPRQYP